MRSYDELERLWAAAGPAPADAGRVRLVVRRTAPAVHEVLERGELCVERGLVGDRWIDAPDPLNQVTLMNARAAELVADGKPLHLPGDNLQVDLDLSEANLPAGARLRVGEAELEVTPEPHLGCGLFAERFGADALRWVNLPAQRPKRLRGVNCRVVTGGVVAVGDRVEVLGR